MTARDVTTLRPITLLGTVTADGDIYVAPAGTAVSAVDDDGRAWLCLYRNGIYWEAHADWHDVADVQPVKRTPAPKPDRGAVHARKASTARRMADKATAALAAAPKPSAVRNDPAVVNVPTSARNLDRDTIRGAALNRLQAEVDRRAGMLAGLLNSTS